MGRAFLKISRKQWTRNRKIAILVDLNVLLKIEEEESEYVPPPNFYKFDVCDEYKQIPYKNNMQAGLNAKTITADISNRKNAKQTNYLTKPNKVQYFYALIIQADILLSYLNQ